MTSVKVTNISPFATSKQVHDLFACIGPVDRLEITDDPAYAVLHLLKLILHKNSINE